MKKILDKLEKSVILGLGLNLNLISVMKLSDIIKKVPGITKNTINYWELCGFITPKKTRVGRIDRREYSQQDLAKIRAIWIYYEQGFSPKVAYKKAVEETAMRRDSRMTGGTESGLVVSNLLTGQALNTERGLTIQNLAHRLGTEQDTASPAPGDGAPYREHTLPFSEISDHLMVNPKRINKLSEMILGYMEGEKVDGIVATSPSTLIIAGAISSIALSKNMTSICPVGLVKSTEGVMYRVGGLLSEGSNVVILSERFVYYEQAKEKIDFVKTEKWKVAKIITLVNSLTVEDKRKLKEEGYDLVASVLSPKEAANFVMSEYGPSGRKLVEEVSVDYCKELLKYITEEYLDGAKKEEIIRKLEKMDKKARVCFWDLLRNDIRGFKSEKELSQYLMNHLLIKCYFREYGDGLLSDDE